MSPIPSSATKHHVALLTSPGMGHVIPIFELGKRLATHHNFHVTIFVVATDISMADSLLKQSYPGHDHLFSIVTLPPPDISGLIDPSATIVTKLAVMMRESLPSLRDGILKMKVPPMALIVDLFGTEALSVADEVGMLKYVFIASNAWFLATTIFLPTVEKNVEDEHIDLKQPLELPGCRPVRFNDTLGAYMDRNDQTYFEYKRVGFQIPMADGILMNTWEDLEVKTLQALKDEKMLGKVTKVPVYPIGPLVRMARNPVQENRILSWLDVQPNESVIYVSFGSGGTLSTKQIIELAWGLELSQQRFIWVVRPPVDDDVSASFFTNDDESDGNQHRYLPNGFINRTHKVGLLVPVWAPQVEILAHPSVGGFLSHCGWNSILESITNGVPMIAWPLYAEQNMNATLLTEEFGVAVRSKKSPAEDVVGREEIELMVRKIMEDNLERQEIRKRVQLLKNSGEKALARGGSSDKSLSQVAKECTVQAG